MSLDSSQQVKKIIQANNDRGKLYMSIEISYNVFDLNHSQMTKKFHTYNTLVFNYLMLLGHECVPKSWVS